MKYQIITSGAMEKDLFVRRVQRKIAEGWQPLGGVAVNPALNRWAQAIVLYENEDRVAELERQLQQAHADVCNLRCESVKAEPRPWKHADLCRSIVGVLNWHYDPISGDVVKAAPPEGT